MKIILYKSTNFSLEIFDSLKVKHIDYLINQLKREFIFDSPELEIKIKFNINHKRFKFKFYKGSLSLFGEQNQTKQIINILETLKQIQILNNA
jgi:hypothetical protein